MSEATEKPVDIHTANYHHGHVIPQSNGRKENCKGPQVCEYCKAEVHYAANKRLKFQTLWRVTIYRRSNREGGESPHLSVVFSAIFSRQPRNDHVIEAVKEMGTAAEGSINPGVAGSEQRACIAVVSNGLPNCEETCTTEKSCWFGDVLIGKAVIEPVHVFDNYGR